MLIIHHQENFTKFIQDLDEIHYVYHSQLHHAGTRTEKYFCLQFNRILLYQNESEKINFSLQSTKNDFEFFQKF